MMIERYHIKERNDISIEVKKSEREEKIECEGVACNRYKRFKILTTVSYYLLC